MLQVAWRISLKSSLTPFIRQVVDHRPRPDFGAIDVAVHIKGDTSAALAHLRCGGSGMRCVRLSSFRAPMRMSRSQPEVRLET